MGCDDENAGPATLGVDAFACTHSGLTERGQPYCFLFSLQSLDRAKQCIPWHIQHHVSGKATAEIQTNLDALCPSLETNLIQVKFVAMDGDNCCTSRQQ
jgi:hypothetical protein